MESVIIEVSRHLVIEGFWPETVFSTLARPDVLAGLLPRLRSFAISERREHQARLAIAIAIGKKFGTVRFTGNVRWRAPDHILFQVRDPLPADVRWNLLAVDEGTLVEVMVWLDLHPWLGPMAYLIPRTIVQGMVGNELEHALAKIAAVLRTEHPPQSCPFPELCLLQHPPTPDPVAHDGNEPPEYRRTEEHIIRKE